jgi:hypothetical protein
MKEQINDAIEILKKQEIEGCITGSCLLDYFEGQDIDLFTYTKSSFTELLFFMKYHPMFQILDPLELHKFNDYIKNDKSSLESLGLVTIKFKYNLCVDVNVIYKKHNKNCFDVISNFDLDIIATAYDIKTGKTLSLRETEGMVGTWNRWNKSFYQPDFWSIKRILRQFERVVKYTQRGYDLTSVTNKYIEIVEDIVKTENFYKTEKGTKYFTDTIEQFEIVLKILHTWKKDLKITPEELLIIKTII